MRYMMAAALAAASFAWGGTAAAECVCGCVNGEVGIICRGSMQAAPQSCAPRVCPAPQPSAAPVVASSAPPPGTTQCIMAQVLNSQTNQYEWVEVCR
jgi:hypothetical protein